MPPLNPTLSRRDTLKALGAGALAASLGQAAPASRVRDPRPNIIFILADDLGYGDLSCYGQRMLRTQCIDQLAVEGTKFTDAYAGSTVCAPSRCCLMTGYHTGHARIRGNATVPLRAEDITVAEVLRDAGYATGLVGKWGLGEPGSTGVPTKQGFDEFFGYYNQRHAHNYFPTHLWRGEERVELDNVVPNEDKVGAGVASERREYSHDWFTNEALSFVERHRAEPFFLYLSYTLPHANNEAGKRGMEIPSHGKFSREPWPEPEQGFAAMLERLDRDVGRLMQQLQKCAIDQHTLVIFTSDNGPHREGGHNPDFFSSSGPLRGIKRDLYEGGIRVPMLCRWPGHVPQGRVTNQITAFWDFLPTAAEFARAEVPDGIDGISMAPSILGRPQPHDHASLYWEFHEGGFKQAVRMGNWKGVRKGTAAPLEVYDLSCDLGEQQDLAASAPDIAAGLLATLETSRTDSPEFPIRERKPK